MVEQSAVNRRVVGSSPTFGAIFSPENEAVGKHRTDSAQNSGKTTPKRVKFPQTVTHRKAEVTIYGKSGSYPFYRIVFRANGKRCMKSFATYGEAKEEAEKKVREISQGSQILALSNKEVTSSLAIRDALESFRRDTGRTVSALTAVTEYLEAAKVLGERQLREAVEGFLQTVAVVRRKPLADAISEFTASRAPKAIGKEGKRSALNPKYVENTANWLRDFSATFPGHGVGDISKVHLNAFIAEYDDLSAKSRNDRRAVVKQFLRWCVRQDYLSASHRLFEADGLITEASDAAPIDYYRPNELRALLEAATIEMRPVIALQAFAGLRLQEALRLDWKDVFGTPGYVSITSGASKTRQRRLVTIWVLPGFPGGFSLKIPKSPARLFAGGGVSPLRVATGGDASSGSKARRRRSPAPFESTAR
jgi:integrase